MTREQYQPSPEKMKKAEKMMTKEEKEKSREREDTFKAGIEHKRTEKEKFYFYIDAYGPEYTFEGPFKSIKEAEKYKSDRLKDLEKTNEDRRLLCRPIIEIPEIEIITEKEAEEKRKKKFEGYIPNLP